jgi:hypothetical protein
MTEVCGKNPSISSHTDSKPAPCPAGHDSTVRAEKQTQEGEMAISSKIVIIFERLIDG